MSKVKISGNPSGTGTFTIAAPNSSTDRTLTLPDEAGTVLTSGGAIDVDASAPADSIAIDSSGYVGIGETSPNAPLSVFRTTDANRIIETRSYDTTTQNHIVFENSSGAVSGYIAVTTSSTAYNTSSDYRLKEDWQPMSGSIDRLKNLNPVNFAWKADGSRVDGFLAHEAAEVVPEAVTGEKDAVDKDGNPQYQGIDQSKLVPLLTAALQEAVAKIEALETRIAALEA